MDKLYTPIDGASYAELEKLAMHRERCRIVFRAEGLPTIRTGVIRDLLTRPGEEFLVLAAGTQIRLDALMRVNGRRYSQGF